MAGLSPRHAKHWLKGGVAKHVICHLVEDGRDRVERDARSRHFDHTNIVFPVANCHRVCQTYAKTMENVLKHI